MYGNEHKEYTVFGETRDIAEDMERLSDTYRILVSQDFINDLQKYNGFTYILNNDKRRAHDEVITYWLLGRVRYAEQSALNEINEEYGAIRDGRIPFRPASKKKTQMSGATAPALTERAMQRRGSIKTHQATQERSKRPSILERRSGPQQPKGRRGSVLEQNKLKEELGLNGTTAAVDLVRLNKNQDLLVVDYEEEDLSTNNPKAPPPEADKKLTKKSPKRTNKERKLKKEPSAIAETPIVVPAASAVNPYELDNESKYGDPAEEPMLEPTPEDSDQVQILPQLDLLLVIGPSNDSLPASLPAPETLTLPAEASDASVITPDPLLYPHSHEIHRLRRRKRRIPHRDSLHSHAETDNPAVHLQGADSAISEVSRLFPEEPAIVPVALAFHGQYPSASDNSMTHGFSGREGRRSGDATVMQGLPMITVDNGHVNGGQFMLNSVF